MDYNQQCRKAYEDKLIAALKKLGFTPHNFDTPSGPWNHLVGHICYDCHWCGGLISGLDAHIEKCTAMPDHLQVSVKNDTDSARRIILAKLVWAKNELSSDELNHLHSCGHGPHVDRLTLLALCEEAKICAYAYDKAERELTETKHISNFMVSAWPTHDLQIMLPPKPEPAKV